MHSYNGTHREARWTKICEIHFNSIQSYHAQQLEVINKINTNSLYTYIWYCSHFNLTPKWTLQTWNFPFVDLVTFPLGIQQVQMAQKEALAVSCLSNYKLTGTNGTNGTLLQFLVCQTISWLAQMAQTEPYCSFLFVKLWADWHKWHKRNLIAVSCLSNYELTGTNGTKETLLQFLVCQTMRWLAQMAQKKPCCSFLFVKL